MDPTRPDRGHDRSQDGAQDAPEPDLVDRLQLRRAAHRGGCLRAVGLTLRPEVEAISMSGSRVLVVLNALALRRLRLPASRRGEPPGAGNGDVQ